MGIRVDWEVEAERERVPVLGEDPQAARRRRQLRLRLLLLILLLLALMAAVATGVLLRLRYVDWQREEALRDTIASEVTALRMGDRALFLSLQRSATADWTTRQESEFERYQQIKQSQEIDLTGVVLDLALEDQRARVLVEEVIDGVRYGRPWFYWRYEDGWHHVPPDYTFWGETRTATNGSVRVRYGALDEPAAQAAAGLAGRWLDRGCAALGCTPPPLTLHITPGDVVTTDWSASEADVLILPSPLVRGGGLDAPFDSASQLEAANFIARWLIDRTTPGGLPPESEAEFLRRASVNWMVGLFLDVGGASPLLESFASAYGEPALAAVLAGLNPGSTVDALAAAAGVSAAPALRVDWSDYLTWRLNSAGSSGQVVQAEQTADGAGNPLLSARVQDAGGALYTATFAWINGRWERTA